MLKMKFSNKLAVGLICLSLSGVCATSLTTQTAKADSSYPGMSNWINPKPKPKKSKNGLPWASSLGNRIGVCIAYGIAGRRGPFGCDS